MYYNKRLYFPDDYGGGGGDTPLAPSNPVQETGGSGNGGGNGNGNGNGGESLNGYNGGMGGVVLDDYGNAISPSEVKEKKIKKLEVQNYSTFINPRGENKTIRVIGTPGAGFTLTIKDSSGCSIMEEELENVEIPKNTIYKFIQEFPDIITGIGGGLTKEYYEITIIPHADVELGTDIENGIPTYTLYQYPDPTITLATTTSQTSPGLSVAVSGKATKKSRAGAKGDSVGERVSSWILTITEDSGTAGNFYIKNTNFDENITSNSVIKKIVIREATESLTSSILNLKPLTTRTIEGVTNSELTAGMIIKGKVEKTKIVTNSLEVPSCKRKTDKFELNNTTDLFKNMFMYIDGVLLARVTSIDCERNITISRKVSIRQNANVVFKHSVGAEILEVVSQSNSEGNACIKIDRYAYIPNNIELEFDDSSFGISGTTRFSGSGTDSIVLTNEIYVTKYGTKDITYTLDLDKIITRKPNARDYDIEVSKNVAHTIVLSKGDFDANKLSKALTITKTSSHGTAVKHVSLPNILYTPLKDFVGDDEIRYKLADDDEATDLSDEKTVRITVK